MRGRRGALRLPGELLAVAEGAAELLVGDGLRRDCRAAGEERRRERRRERVLVFSRRRESPLGLGFGFRFSFRFGPGACAAGAALFCSCSRRNIAAQCVRGDKGEDVGRGGG